MVDPDVPAVDDAREQPLFAEPVLAGDELGVVAAAVLVDVRAELVTVDAAREVQADALDRQVPQHAVRLADVVEVGLHQEPRALAHLAELLVRHRSRRAGPRWRPARPASRSPRHRPPPAARPDRWR